VTEQFFYDKMREQRALLDLMSKRITNFIGISPRIKLVEKGSLQREGENVKKFVDHRFC
jgi:phenylacetate-CoA ligase